MAFYTVNTQSSDAVLKLVELTQKNALQWTPIASSLVPPIIAIDTSKPCFTAHYRGRDLYVFKKLHKRSLIGAYGLVFSEGTGEKGVFPELSSINDLFLAAAKQTSLGVANLDTFIHDILTP